MSAYDALEGFLSELSAGEREQLRAAVEAVRQDLFAARSEEARVRIVHDFIRDARTILKRRRAG